MCLPPHLLKYTTHLLRCCAKINAQRTPSTSPLYFCSRLVSAPSISKGLRKGHLLRYCAQINPQRINTAMDGGGSA